MKMARAQKTAIVKTGRWEKDEGGKAPSVKRGGRGLGGKITY